MPTFSSLGVGLFAISSVFESLRMALSQALLQPMKLSPFESLIYTSPVVTALGLVCG